MCTCEHSSICHTWPLEHFSLILSLHPSFSSPLPSLAHPEALQLVTVLLISNALRKVREHLLWTEPGRSSHRTIPEISLNLHLRFHLPQGDRRMEVGICAIGWERKEETEVIRISDFPCRTGEKRGRLDVALVTTGVPDIVCVLECRCTNTSSACSSCGVPAAFSTFSTYLS